VKKWILFLSAAALIILQSSWLGVKRDPIKLIPEKLDIDPAEFYIKDVIDARPAAGPVLTIVLPDQENIPLKQSVPLYGGDVEAIRNFISQSLVKNTSKRPLLVRIVDCKVQEDLTSDNRISGRAAVVFQFELEKETGNVPLTQYRATAKYTRSLNNITAVEPVLRQLLGNGMKFINTWMNREVSANINLAQNVEISFTDHVVQDADTVYYEPSRPLIWDDFRDKPRDSKYTAAVFSAFGYDQNREVINGSIHIGLNLRIYMVKSDSWVYPGRQDSYALNHEQRHFDLVKIIAGKFKDKLRKENLTPDNYEGIINYEYLEFYREMNQMQKKYDLETGHGTNRIAQEEWNRNIDKDLGMENRRL
jgi:hypothetical protein